MATRFNSTVESIIIVNQLSPDAYIYETQQILIPVQTLPTARTQAAGSQQLAAPTATPTETAIVVQPAQTQATVAPAAQGTPVMQRYVVRYGDTLSTIAHLFGVSLRDLAHANGIVNPNMVYVGQVLRIPVSGTPTPLPPPTLAPSPTSLAPTATQITAKPQYYTVQPGDNLYRISIRFNVPIVALIEANGIYDANFIFVGEILVIP